MSAAVSGSPSEPTAASGLVLSAPPPRGPASFLSRSPRLKPPSLDGPATLAALSTARSIIARLRTTSWCSATVHASFAASDKA